jgi:hypothetical protein
MIVESDGFLQIRPLLNLGTGVRARLRPVSPMAGIDQGMKIRFRGFKSSGPRPDVTSFISVHSRAGPKKSPQPCGCALRRSPPF